MEGLDPAKATELKDTSESQGRTAIAKNSFVNLES